MHGCQPSIFKASLAPVHRCERDGKPFNFLKRGPCLSRRSLPETHHVSQTWRLTGSSVLILFCWGSLWYYYIWQHIWQTDRVLSLAAANSCIMKYAEDYSNFFLLHTNTWSVEVCVGVLWFKWNISQSGNEIKWVRLAYHMSVRSWIWWEHIKQFATLVHHSV